MEEIKKALEILENAEEARKLVDKFARSKYHEKFANTKIPHGTYRAYSHFKVVSKTKIIVNYSYGAGDMDFDDDFVVELK